MGLFSTLFGKAPSASTQNLGLLDPAQQQILLETLKPFLEQGLGTARTDIPDLTSLESTSLEGLEQAALSGRGTETVDASSKFLQDLLGGGQGLEDEFFKTNVQDPLLESFQDEILPGISRTFASDFFSSDRANADERAMEELIQQLVRGKSDVALRGRGQRIEAAGLAPGADAFGIERLLAFLQAGGVGRENERFGLEQENTRVNQLLQLLGIPTRENVVISTGGKQGLLPSLIQAGGQVGAAALRKG